MNIKTSFLAIVMMMCASTLFGQQQFEYELWQGKPQVKSKDKEDIAMIYVSLPAENKASGRAVLICPGGGYEHLAMEHEGREWESFFNRMGIATIVLKYRMPHGNKDIPVSDAEQAIKLIRANATNWHINTEDVGIMGFSAGGHLASTVATHGKGEAHPNFEILFYPVITMDPSFTHKGSHDNLLGEKAKKKDELNYSNDMQVSRNTPRTFIILSQDDDVVDPQNSADYWMALMKNDVPTTFVSYPTGGHGWGIRPTFAFHLEMLLNLKAWLDSF